MGITLDFGPSIALVSPWMDGGTLTSFLDQNRATLTLLNRLFLVRTSTMLSVCALELTLSYPSFMTSPLASITVSEHTNVQGR